MCKKPLFSSLFFWKKEVKLGKNQKKAGAGINCGPWPIFQISHIWPTFIFGVSNAPDTFFFTFSAKNRSNNKIFGKKNLQASTRSHDPFFDKSQIWPTFIYLYHQFLKSSCACSNSWPTKKNLRASTRTHDPFFDNPKIWPTFIYRGEVPAHTFAKLPVRALINDPKKNWYRNQLQPMAHFLTTPKFDLLSYISYHQFFKSSCACSNSWPTKKNLRASTRTHDPFFDNPKIWPTFIYRGEVPAHTFAKLPLRALINDLKKLFQKKVYVTIPQWFETFPNMSNLRSGRNRAKCGLVLNDPIDWFKLRLNQRTRFKT